MTELVEFFGAYGTLPPRVGKNALNKKLFFLGAIALMALALNGCFLKIIILKTVDEKLIERGINPEHVRDIEMQNAALKAANEYLRNGR